MGSEEKARHWQDPGLPGVDLLRARYVRKTFVRHTHESFVIAAITEGVETFHHRGAVERAGPGALALINPDTAHTGQAGVPEGWTYSVLYPAADTVARIAAETTTVRGTVGFTVPVADDPYTVRLVTEVLRAVDERNPLAADTLMRHTVARVLRAHGGALPARTPRTAGARKAERARALLEERLAGPPSLEQLASCLDTSPFALLRASGSFTGCRPIPGSPTRGSAAPAASWRREPHPPRWPPPSASPTSRTSIATSPALSASRRALMPVSAQERTRRRSGRARSVPL
jgi:AraC-like DNA-binding protein